MFSISTTACLDEAPPQQQRSGALHPIDETQDGTVDESGPVEDNEGPPGELSHDPADTCNSEGDCEAPLRCNLVDHRCVLPK
jgi:hypothetical protein